MRAEEQIRRRFDGIQHLLGGPLEVERRGVLEERAKVLEWVLDKWLFTHDFESWTKASGKKQDTCGKCGRLPSDPIHHEKLDG